MEELETVSRKAIDHHDNPITRRNRRRLDRFNMHAIIMYDLSLANCCCFRFLRLCIGMLRVRQLRHEDDGSTVK